MAKKKRKKTNPPDRSGRIVTPSGAVTSKPGKRCDQGKKPKSRREF